MIAIPTFKRPTLLRAALDESVRQAKALSAAGQVEVSTLVVDNDPHASAESTARAFGARYVVEPVPGVSAVRNRTLDESADADLLVCLDDDEVPQPGWLSELVTMKRATGADAIAGRVSTALPDEADEWVRAAYIRPSRRNGQALRECATNNLLLDLHTVRRLGLRFDPAFGLTGGEDSVFTSTLVRRGGTIRWAQHAHVVETVGPERLERRWLITLAYRFGNTRAHLSQRRRSSRLGRVAGRCGSVGGGIARVGVGGLQALAGLARRDVTRRVLGLRRAAIGTGMVAGAFGHSYDEYARRRAAEEGSRE
ncbi:glycosyltransferase family 2 protein [Janibacter sp. GXQ6167]|uniref:glycosyltransferase family 2 protein n=1 Tax=Janibacter sp. GXQ6167 TaxID=3240791 RepID=UPI0035266D03